MTTQTRFWTETHASSAMSEWETPPEIFVALDAEFHFTLDVCATPQNAKCARYFTVDDNALAQDWGREICFMNPPYGRGVIGPWLLHAWLAALKGATVVCLLPARTDTSWWHDLAMQGEVRFLRGRVSFLCDGKRTNPAPFPSAVVIFRPAVRP